MGWNIFRILGDCSHLLSKCILIFAIHRNRSAEGVSMITQGLYTLVFLSRYTDFFRETSTWNWCFKFFYITSSIYIVGIMRWIYPRTREREIAWKLGGAALAASLFLSPFAMLIFEGKDRWSFFTWLWDFSQILESVCILPQLLLLRQTTVPTVIDSFYLLTLGAYRGLYCLNWIWREIDVNDIKPNAVSIIFGVIQTALYLDFFWVYYTRQRVKLRAGGVVDADDIRRGWLLNRIFGNKRFENVDQGDDEESAPALGGHNTNGNGNGNAASSQQRRSKWGARGISISADDTTLEQDRHHDNDDNDAFNDSGVDPDAKMKDPDELAHALDDDDEEDGTLPSGSSSRGDTNKTVPSGVSNGNEWRDS
ncbi:Uu.00g031330.m01.CDS01 [Anthostomella pinea]|uniref:Uu.00g031330.m01.CDS01 n=1 Tax=Anthostomella pinea TaxID=933095 RepID=A0AAI8YD15_9PEZI|nr:Uu.00g031330.m01.CDS01 [Anthostomella pinea]